MKTVPDGTIKVGHICLSLSLQAELRTDSLEEKLKVLIGNLPSGGVTLAEIRDLVGQDGLCVLFGHLANIATIIYFTVLTVGGGAAIFEALRHFTGKAA